MKDEAGTIRVGLPPCQPEAPARESLAPRHTPSLALRAGGSRHLPLYLFCILTLTTSACDQSNPKQPTAKPAAAVPVMRTAERGPVKLTVQLDRTEATVPEQLTLNISLQAEIGVEAGLPEIGQTLGDFAVVSSNDAPVAIDGVYRRQERAIKLESVIPGKCSVPPIEVAFADRRPKADGSNNVYEDKVATEPITVTIAQSLADAKGPLGLPMSWQYRLLLWALGVVAAMVLIAFAARWWRRRHVAKPEPLWARRMVLHDWALSELDKLIAENLVGRGMVQEYYYRINGLLRRYIELRFGLMAGEQTSEEFIRDLQRSARFDQRHREVLQRFVAACDPVKYAKYQPQPDEIDWVHAAAREFVNETSTEAADEPRASARAAVPSEHGIARGPTASLGEASVARDRTTARTEVRGSSDGENAEGAP